MMYQLVSTLWYVLYISAIYDDLVFFSLKLPLYSTPSLEVVFIPDQKALTVTHKDFLIETPFETGTISFYGRVVKSTKTVCYAIFLICFFKMSFRIN